MSLIVEPAQYTTADGSLAGAVDGHNDRFSFVPYPSTFLYATQGVTGALIFGNGLLIDEYEDYSDGPGYFTFVNLSVNDTITAEIYLSGGPSKMRLSGGGLVSFGTQSMRIVGANVPQSVLVPFLLFRNGQLLTKGADYTVSGAWIGLMADQALQPGDTFTALIGMGGTYCSTFDGSIAGTINGSNATFTLPVVSAAVFLFRNGQFLTEGLDYLRSSPTQVVLLGAQVPQPGDTLTAQIFAIANTVQVSNVDGSLYTATAAESLLFRNGMLMTQPIDGVTVANTAILALFQTPAVTNVVTVRAWTPDVLDPLMLPLDLPQQFSSIDGSLAGVLNGVNNLFTLLTGSLVTQIQLFWNGLLMTQGIDYSWTCLENSSAGPWATTITMMNGQYPHAGNNLTAEVYFS